MRFEIKSITIEGDPQYDNITGVGSPMWSPSWIPVKDIITKISSGHEFFLKDEKQREFCLRPFPHPKNGPYVRTSPDDSPSDILFKLPRAPK